MPDPRPLVFADLDDSLFQTTRKMAGADRHKPAATAANGDPRKASFMTEQQSALFDWLLDTTELIPVTARSGDAFGRVTLPFDSWAITSNGAMILEPDGKPHAPWTEKMTKVLTPMAQQMSTILEQGRAAATSAKIDVRSWIVTEDDVATYVVFKLNDVTTHSLTALKRLAITAPGWTRHFNAEALALIPPGSGKAAATEYLHNRLNADGSRPTLGLGDSTSDLSFMRLADILMIPAKSQIADSL